MPSRPRIALNAVRSSLAKSRTGVRIAIVACLPTFTLAGPAAAQHNRFFNPELDSNTVGWVYSSAPVPSGWDPEDRDGCEGSGSAIVSGLETDVPDYLAYFTQCIPVFGSESLDLEIEARTLFAPDTVWWDVSIVYTNDECEIPGFTADGVVGHSLPLGSWTHISGDFLVPMEAAAAWVTVQLTSNAPFDALLDGAWGAESPARILDDGFEYGSTCRW